MERTHHCHTLRVHRNAFSPPECILASLRRTHTVTEYFPSMRSNPFPFHGFLRESKHLPSSARGNTLFLGACSFARHFLDNSLAHCRPRNDPLLKADAHSSESNVSFVLRRLIRGFPKQMLEVAPFFGPPFAHSEHRANGFFQVEPQMENAQKMEGRKCAWQPALQVPLPIHNELLVNGLEQFAVSVTHYKTRNYLALHTPIHRDSQRSKNKVERKLVFVL